MNNVEQSSQRAMARFTKTYREGSKLRWANCVQSLYVLSDHRLTLARDLALSIYSINNMQAAGFCYRNLRKWAGQQDRRTKMVKRLHTVREKLTYTHFVYAGRYQVMFDIPPLELFEALETAAKEGASSDDLASYLKGEFASEQENQNFWKPALVKAHAALNALFDNFATPHELKQEIIDMRSKLARYL